jgi:CYTH domain-containing protein
MTQEIERKFLLKNDTWRALAQGMPYRQGYLNSAKERTVRVRTIGDTAFLTIKGVNVGATRAEYEYPIPLTDCNAMLDTLAEKPLIEKKRYKIQHGGLTWEIDEFFGDNQGLIVAEVELQREDQAFDKPDWIGDEVTTDPRYFNSNLVKHPYTQWHSAKIAPRAEFRVFGQGVIDTVQQKMWEAGATLQKARAMPAETYFISRHTDAANVKVRDGLLDIKLKTGETAEGYEVFEPAGKFQFPVKQADLAAILGHLKVATTLDKSIYTYDEFLVMARAHADLLPVAVEKMRYGFTVNGVICEYARVKFNGALIETVCCESENHAAVKQAIEALGIAALTNTSYLKAAKRITGII